MKPIVDFRGSQRTIGPDRARKLLALLLNNNNMPHGWQILGIECKDVLSIGVPRLLIGNRVGVGLTRSTIRHLLPSLFPVKGASK